MPDAGGQLDDGTAGRPSTPVIVLRMTIQESRTEPRCRLRIVEESTPKDLPIGALLPGGAQPLRPSGWSPDRG